MLWISALWYLVFGFVGLYTQSFLSQINLIFILYYLIAIISGILSFIGGSFIWYNNSKGKISCLIGGLVGLIGLVIVPFGISAIFEIGTIPLDIMLLFLLFSIFAIIGGILDWIGFKYKGSRLLRREENRTNKSQ